MWHQNNITYFILLGFPNLQNFKILFLLTVSVIYNVTIFGNVFIIILFLRTKSLQSPMYFFITQLSVIDLVLTTVALPILLHAVLYNGSVISITGCITQFTFFVTALISECYLLTLMSYDRYLAICRPLHYNSLINIKFGIKAVIFIWFISFGITMTDSIVMANLNFCGPNVIDHFYCDIEPVIKLACSDTSWIHVQIVAIAFICIISPFLIIVFSYIYIASTILKIKSAVGRKKAFTTCSSHLTGVSIYYGALFVVYAFPTKGQEINLDKILSLFFTVMTPLLNPIIYTFRNKDFKKAFQKLTSSTLW